jgi:chromosome segregation ATPase
MGEVVCGGLRTGKEAQEELEALKADGDAEALRQTLDTTRSELQAMQTAQDELQSTVEDLKQQLADTKVRTRACLCPASQNRRRDLEWVVGRGEGLYDRSTTR